MVSKRLRRRALLGGVLAVVWVFAIGAVALASGAVAPPSLRLPRSHAQVQAGTITLLVHDRGVTGRSGLVFVAINRTRKLDRHHFLDGTCDAAKGCDIIIMSRWAHHRGWWTYTTSGSFPGYWATTPGTYYWQAQRTPPARGCAGGCDLDSAIHVFHVS